MKALALATTLSTALIGWSPQSLSPEAIEAAIAQGQAGKKLEKRCTGYAENSFDIVAEGPVGRIMRAAREAAKRGERFTAADVTAAMTAQWLTVTATRVESLRAPVLERRTPDSPPPSLYRTELSIKSRPPRGEDAQVLLPVGHIAYNSDNVPGHRVVITRSPAPADFMERIAVPGSDMRAAFDLAAFKAMPHKDVEIYVFMTDSGGQSCRISQAQRQALQ